MKVYLVKYIGNNGCEDDTIEGYVNKIGDFDKWLRERNKQRRADGELVERKDEFSIEEIYNLNEQ